MTRRQALQDTPAAVIFPATSQYNNTIVQCAAIVIAGENSFRSFSSRNATLQIQGVLTAVCNLYFHTREIASNSITISWEPPFSLNLTTAEPDIQYCVNVYNATRNDILVVSECNITKSSFVFIPSNQDPNIHYVFTVTPRSNVQGSSNGTTSETVLGYLCQGNRTI